MWDRLITTSTGGFVWFLSRRRAKETERRGRGWQRWREEGSTVTNWRSSAWCGQRDSQQQSACTLCTGSSRSCVIGRSCRERGSLRNPAQGSSSSLSELAVPSQRPLAFLSKLQSSFKNKEPLRHVRWGKPCSDNASQTPHWHFHGWFFFLFHSFFSLNICMYFFLPAWPLEKFHICFLSNSLFS